MKQFIQHIRDAWLVLTGREHETRHRKIVDDLMREVHVLERQARTNKNSATATYPAITSVMKVIKGRAMIIVNGAKYPRPDWIDGHEQKHAYAVMNWIEENQMRDHFDDGPRHMICAQTKTGYVWVLEGPSGFYGQAFDLSGRGFKVPMGISQDSLTIIDAEDEEMLARPIHARGHYASK